jgi:HD-GYP domain-containing protein (c-di-GMP phosphodiesterase class II)
MIGHTLRDTEDVTVEEPTRGTRSLFIESAETSPVRSRDADILQRLLADMGSVDAGLLDHGRRTAQYSVALGHALHLSGTDLVHLYCAGLLHDIGKLTLPRDLLRQQTPFSPEDYAVMQCHPRSGAEMLAGIPYLRTAAVWIAHHHERWDGTGYPYGLRDFLIPLGSRILAVADLFDELAFSTEYQKGPRVAMALLSRAAGSQLDPLLVERFVATLNEL